MAQEQVELFKHEYENRYPKAVASLMKNEEQLLSFYDFPAAHWQTIQSPQLVAELLDGKKFLDGQSEQAQNQDECAA